MAMLQKLTGGLSSKAARHYCSKPFTLANRAPMVSVTFDDVPDSAYRNGAAILEEFGWRGTFYVASGICGTRDEFWDVISHADVGALHRRGHEVGCHTFSHVPVATLDADALADEITRNHAMLRALCGDIALTNFCFPFGKVSLPRKLQLQARFDTCRSIYEGVNAGRIDLAMLRVIELYDRTLTPEKLSAVLRETRERNGWLILYTHDVAEKPSWIGCSPQRMRETLAAVRDAGLDVLTIRDALDLAGYRRAIESRAA
jgi:peptidoglycan/xylan/chitin deacetylase (PgdA/CDA1 family)